MRLAPGVREGVTGLCEVDFGEASVRETLRAMSVASDRELLRLSAELSAHLAARALEDETLRLLRAALLRGLVTLLGEALAEHELAGTKAADVLHTLRKSAALLATVRDKPSRGSTEETLH